MAVLRSVLPDVMIYSFINILEQHTASIFTICPEGEGMRLLQNIDIIYQTTWCNIPQDRIFHIQPRENHRSVMKITLKPNEMAYL
jgi:hypothetical protein